MTINWNMAEFVRSAAKPADFPRDGLPQVVFAGRSNVGKSSAINRLLNRKNFARVGSAPGKTTHINYFLIEKKLYLVDLPGYGYAKVSKEARDGWRVMIDEYLQGWPGRNLFLQLVDIRHEPSALDKQMWQYLQGFCRQRANAECRLVATKVDKISKGARERQLAMIAKTLGAPRSLLLPFSVPAHEGREELLSWLEEFLHE